jgi:short-subunit dehydrogenase
MAPRASGELKNRICLITGATSGISYVTARELARKGATVALVARSESRAKESVTPRRPRNGSGQSASN